MLISDEYKRLNSELHSTNEHYGTSAINHVNDILSFYKRIGATSILDYGCGKGTLKFAMGKTIDVREYDPAIEGKDDEPEPADLLVCTDVMEHIEPECMEKVISHITSKTKLGAFITICTSPAKKFLADGRNAHISLHSCGEWVDKFAKHFQTLVVMQSHKNQFWLLLNGVKNE